MGKNRGLYPIGQRRSKRQQHKNKQRKQRKQQAFACTALRRFAYSAFCPVSVHRFFPSSFWQFIPASFYIIALPCACRKSSFCPATCSPGADQSSFSFSSVIFREKKRYSPTPVPHRNETFAFGQSVSMVNSQATEETSCETSRST